jgi:hypothetical protein
MTGIYGKAFEISKSELMTEPPSLRSDVEEGMEMNGRKQEGGGFKSEKRRPKGN